MREQTPSRPLRLHLATTPAEMEWAQMQVEKYHYLRQRVHPRARPITYLVMIMDEKGVEQRVGCLIFGRMQSSRCRGWYGNMADVQSGWARLTQWELLCLQRVYLDPRLQRGGQWYVPNAATQMVGQALRRVGYEYLLIHPPAFLDQPWQLKEILSYCHADRFLCTLYLAANFKLFRENSEGLRTYVRPLPQLQPHQLRHIEEASRFNAQARKRRSATPSAYIQETLLRQRRVGA